MLAFPLAVAFGLALTPIVSRVAWAVGYLDHPEARKLHTSATALLGGVGISGAALAAWLASASGRPADVSGDLRYVLGGALIALLLGLWDDRFGMHPILKLAGQTSAATVLLASGAVPDLHLGPVANVLVTLVVLVALMNAVNFLDNMNGMIAGLSAIALIAFAWGSFERGTAGLAAAQLALAGACLGFLPYNFPSARIFLGDAGSLLLGYSLGASAVLAFTGGPRGWGQLGPVLALAYPAFDMTFVVITRLRDGRKIYLGGRDHTNHRLASVLKCPKKAVMLLWLSGAALSASGLVVQKLDQAMPALALVSLWSALLLATGIRLSSVPIEANPPPPFEVLGAPRPRARRASLEPDEIDSQLRELVAHMARGIVDRPGEVRVEILEPGVDAQFELSVDPDDLGHVIGKQGRTARSLRLALSAAASRRDRQASLEIAD